MASELGGVKKLETAQQYTEQAIEGAQARKTQLQQFATEYSTLLTRLQTLPQKTRHELMVPLGPLAFQPGFIHHTNEITVLLGENFFVERSAMQAAEIIKRRQAYLKKQIETIDAQLTNTTNMDSTSKQMFGGKSASKKTVTGDSELDASLGVRFKDGVMINEEGEEIVEIKEEFIEEDEIEEKQSTHSASAATSSSSSSASTTSKPTTSSTTDVSDEPTSSIDFPSMLDKNFDQFWDELEQLEQQQEAEQATPPSTTPTTPTAATPDTNSSSVADLQPVPSPTLRPITSPADIFRHITEAKLKAGEVVPQTEIPRPLPPPATATTPKSPTTSSSTTAATSSASTSLDAAFAEYRLAKKKQRVRALSSGKKQVLFADETNLDDYLDSDDAFDKGEPIAPVKSTTAATPIKSVLSTSKATTPKSATTATHAPKSVATSAGSVSSSAATAAASTPTRPSSTATMATGGSTTARAAFTGEIRERSSPIQTGPTSTPFSSNSLPVSASSSATRPISTPTTTVKSSLKANPPKMSKFKAKMLGLETEDD